MKEESVDYLHANRDVHHWYSHNQDLPCNNCQNCKTRVKIYCASHSKCNAIWNVNIHNTKIRRDLNMKITVRMLFLLLHFIVRKIIISLMLVSSCFFQVDPNKLLVLNFFYQIRERELSSRKLREFSSLNI